jgi:hypothetical protein
MDIFKIKSQIKSPYFNMILKISKLSQNDLKSDFVKSSIKSLNTLEIGEPISAQGQSHASLSVRLTRAILDIICQR